MENLICLSFLEFLEEFTWCFIKIVSCSVFQLYRRAVGLKTLSCHLPLLLHFRNKSDFIFLQILQEISWVLFCLLARVRLFVTIFWNVIISSFLHPWDAEWSIEVSWMYLLDPGRSLWFQVNCINSCIGYYSLEWNQLYILLMNRRKSSYWSDNFQLKVFGILCQ